MKSMANEIVTRFVVPFTMIINLEDLDHSKPNYALICSAYKMMYYSIFCVVCCHFNPEKMMDKPSFRFNEVINIPTRWKCFMGSVFVLSSTTINLSLSHSCCVKVKNGKDIQLAQMLATHLTLFCTSAAGVYNWLLCAICKYFIVVSIYQPYKQQ